MRQRTWALLSVLVAALLASLGGIAAGADPTLVDDFEGRDGWTVTHAPGARAGVVWEADETNTALRFDYDLGNGTGFATLRKAVRLSLPENFAFAFRLRGEGPPVTLELKVVDTKGNVWWRRWPRGGLPAAWQSMVARRSRLAYAWGPSPDRGPRDAVALEIAVSGGQAGAGTLWLDDLVLEPREPVAPNGVVPQATASSAQAGSGPELAADGDPATAWRSDALPEPQWLRLDFGRNHEYGGLVIDWDPEDYAVAWGVEVSIDGQSWQRVHSTETGKGGRVYVYMPDTECRFVRLAMDRGRRGRGFGIAEIAVKPVAFSESRNAFFSWIARDAPPGHYPKYLLGLQTYWTVVGVDGGHEEALVNEEGMVDVGGAFSIEPFFHRGGKFVTWHDVAITQALEDGELPMPTVTWRADGLRLDVTAFASGAPDDGTLILRYRLTQERDASPERVRLLLAIRPFQVLPPWQSLNVQGGVTNIGALKFDGQAVWVDRTRAVVPLAVPTGFGAATFEAGRLTEVLERGGLPGDQEVSDPLGLASGVLAFDVDLAPGATKEVALAVPLDGHTPERLPRADTTVPASLHEEVRRGWKRQLDRVEVTLPPSGAAIERTLGSTIGYILVNRDGPALQPGARTYARSWIRDGAMESEALLQMGITEPVRDFLRWYAGYQALDGQIPCCIDARGPDWTPEHDSIGAFLYALGEYYRYTRDAAFVHELWPNVVRAVERLVALRGERMTPAYREPGQEAYFGLLPESISHEGYSGHPVHSYWDDFFALRGLKDVVMLARVLGDDELAATYAALRDQFRATLQSSLDRTIARHGIDYVPGSVELGDFDPTSTSIAIVPGGELANLPGAALQRTYDRYWGEIEQRLQGTWSGEAYSPYELRNVGAFVRLGQRERALGLLAYLMGGRRPAPWNEWAEVVWLDPDLPRFIGDMPHTWVGAGFVQAIRTMLAYERESDQALVVGAGLDPAWVTAEPGVTVRRLPTHWGILNFSVRATGPDGVRVRISGDLTIPPGKIVLASPLDRPITAVKLNGRPVELADPNQVRIEAVPADLELSYAAPARDAGSRAWTPSHAIAMLTRLFE